jgi:hypothetical protein
LFQHAVQGWCPPVPILRRMGFRTIYEIEQERRELLALRNVPRTARTPRSSSSRKTKSRSDRQPRQAAA